VTKNDGPRLPIRYPASGNGNRNAAATDPKAVALFGREGVCVGGQGGAHDFDAFGVDHRALGQFKVIDQQFAGMFAPKEWSRRRAAG